MFVAGAAYICAGASWWVEGKYWLALTFFLYAMTIVTLYMAGSE